MDLKDVKYVVSACLLGENCKYNGDSNRNGNVISFLNGIEYVSVCPEILAGMGVPREQTEITEGDGNSVLEERGKVRSVSGNDITDKFILGAKRALDVTLKNGCKLAILKARSPSCGSGVIYNGKFDGGKKKGDGVFCALLKKYGIYILTEEDLEEILP